MLPDLGRRDPSISKGYGHARRDVGMPGLMGSPSPWGAAAGYTAEALKTHCSGVLQAAAGHGGEQNKGYSNFLFHYREYLFWGGEGGVGRNDPTQTVLILVKRCVCY